MGNSKMVKLVQSTLRTWVFRVLGIRLVNELQVNQTTTYNDLLPERSYLPVSDNTHRLTF